jgi:threonine synthase
MGLPIDKLVCASNSNKVLYDFFRTGKYDRNREFILTSSPSMDILVSSNLERLIYHIAGDSASKDSSYMKDLVTSGKYSITEEMKDKLGDFSEGYASEDDTASAIRSLYDETGYVIDPHTAVARHVYKEYVEETGDKTPTVIVSTASPFKFETSVLKAIGLPTDADDLSLADELSKAANVAVPDAILSLKGADIRHKMICGKDEMKDEVLKFLGID